jgi:hypothetical protein
MTELIDKFLFIDVVSSTEQPDIRYVLSRLSYLRTIFTVAISTSPDGSIVASLYDGYCFDWDNRRFCISNWKYRDIAEGNITEAVWERSKPWILEHKDGEQFMCKTIYMLKVSAADECQLISWNADKLIDTTFTLNGISGMSKSLFTDDKKISELVIELINKGIFLSKVDEVGDDLP